MDSNFSLSPHPAERDLQEARSWDMDVVDAAFPQSSHPSSEESSFGYSNNAQQPISTDGSNASSISTGNTYGSHPFHHHHRYHPPSSPEGFYPPPPPPHHHHHHHPPPPPYVMYSWGPYGPPPPWAPPQQPPTPVEYIENIKPTDVLCGRGGATNSHSGNRSFRALVKQHQDRYLGAKKRDKPAVAAEVVDLIRKRGGRFLRRCTPSPYAEHPNQVVWVDIGDDRAKEKTCQALREGAPELRRMNKKRQRAKRLQRQGMESSPKADHRDDEDEEEDSDDNDDTSYRSPDKVSPQRSKRSTGSDQEGRIQEGKRKHGDISTEDSFYTPPKSSRVAKGRAFAMDRDENEDEEAAISCIRPCPILLMDKNSTLGGDIALSELSPQERTLYLQYFVPPHPTIRKGLKREKVLTPSKSYESAAADPMEDGVGDDENVVSSLSPMSPHFAV